jgi:hypothetical protein
MVSFRDSSVVIIESGRTLIRAGLGLQDLLKAPSVVRIIHFRVRDSTYDAYYRKYKLASVFGAIQGIVQMAHPH